VLRVGLSPAVKVLDLKEWLPAAGADGRAEQWSR